ncbi:MAG TPA: FAD-dependent oxidoreductase [Blastocatellia bacterium]|jgi:FADH2 O2-dependent halogenase|nr:FAD-dependent oxidoreductase [Blastocatellia bacterium]
MYYDIAVVGSGFGGSLLAMIARRLGRSVILLEKFKHPRFAIGESSTPVANLLLEEMAIRYNLPDLLPLIQWGSWQERYPEIACGLKRGFTFYHHTFDRRFTADPDRSDQLLVAASPHDGVSDTHWYRPDFDHFLVRMAQKAGAVYLDEVALDAPTWPEEGVLLEGHRNGEPISIRAGFIFDATGPRGFLHRALKLSEVVPEGLPPTQALYTHFTGAHRLDEMGIYPTDELPPYPIDDAAVHHVFDGGWIWVLRFNNGITSAGVAARGELAEELRFAEGAAAWERLLGRLPTVREQFGDATAQLAFAHQPRLSFHSGSIAGERWAMLPSAAGFVDPLLSTGFPLTLLGVTRLAETIERDWATPNFESSLKKYAEQTSNELSAAERLVAALYASMNDFPLFTSLSLLYFAAASFTETARRLDRPGLAGGFLMRDHPIFGPRSRDCLELARHGLTPEQREELIERIQRAIEPFDVAGLGDRSRRNWYPVKAEDLFGAAGKLGANHAEIEKLLSRSGFY